VLSVTAHRRVTGPIVLAAFRAACGQYGWVSLSAWRDPLREVL
jgi:hypothetical protein